MFVSFIPLTGGIHHLFYKVMPPSYVKKTNVNQEDNLAELYHKSSQK